MERVEAMAKRLTNLEDYLSDEDVGDLPLDTDSLVTMIGIDAADIEVIADGGSHPTEAMRSWAKELQLGSWFSLDHNGKVSHVQFAWCSDRKQLHLFASTDGRNFLIQARRLAAYLQAGLAGADGRRSADGARHARRAGQARRQPRALAGLDSASGFLGVLRAG
jgi:hypothetical protein